MGLGYRDGGSDIDVLLPDDVFKEPRSKMTERVQRNDLFGIRPLWERPDTHRWLAVCEVGLVFNVQILACNRQGMVNGV
jgi:hypothetical protein